MSALDLSVVIGFRNWGVERLRRSVESMRAAAGDVRMEVIISDYGSDDPAQAGAVAAELGARHLHTAGDSVWSRSRALNAGFAAASGELLVSTDADMLFAPGSFEAIVETARRSAPAALFLQCRDLPEDIPESLLDAPSAALWEMLDQRSAYRPRWGMGGMMAIDRQGFEILNGFDERLHTYGREDLDFALRARRAGYRTVWVSDPRARMYHMWHPRTGDDVSSTAQGREAIARNRRLVDSDATTSRNVTRSRPALREETPLLSVIVMPPPQECGENLHAAVATCLAQTVQNIEVLVPAPSALQPPLPDDPRVQVLPVPPGKDSLRTAAERAAGVFTAVVSPGVLAAPHHLEALLAAAVEGVGAIHCAAAELAPDGSIAVPVHGDTGTLMAASSLLRGLIANGDGTLTSSGLRDLLRHVGTVVAEAPGRSTIRLPGAGHVPSQLLLEGSDEERALMALLPRELNPGGRIARISRLRPQAALPRLDGDVEFSEIRFEDASLHTDLVVYDASYEALIALARAGEGLTVGLSGGALERADGGSWLRTVIDHARRDGLRLPVAIDRSPQGADLTGVYQIKDAAGIRMLRARDLDSPALPGDVPWLVIEEESHA